MGNRPSSPFCDDKSLQKLEKWQTWKRLPNRDMHHIDDMRSKDSSLKPGSALKTPKRVMPGSD